MPLEKFGEVGGCHVTGGPALSGQLIRQASQYGPDTACQLGVQLISLVLRHLRWRPEPDARPTAAYRLRTRTIHRVSP